MYRININRENGKIVIRLYKQSWIFWWCEIAQFSTSNEIDGLRYVSKVMKHYTIASDCVIDKTKILIK